MDETLEITDPLTLSRFLSAMNPGVVDRQGAVRGNTNLLRQPLAPAEPRRMAGMGWALDGGRRMAMGCEGGQGWFFGRPVPAGKLPWSTEGPIP
jgi:hypothetical protein